MGQINDKGSAGNSASSFEETLDGSVEDFLSSPTKEVEVKGHKVLIVNDNGKFYAIGWQCPYGKEPLVDAVVNDEHIRCPQHGARFNLSTGDVTDYPAMDCLQSFKVRVDGDKLVIEADKKTLSEPTRVKRSLRLFPSDKRTIVIIGAGAAGIICAETLRQEGFYGRLLMFSRENRLPYDRTQLNKKTDVNDESLNLRQKFFWSVRDIQIKLEKEVVKVNFNQNKVVLKDGEEIGYHKLLIACGARAKKLTMVRGYDLHGVHTLRTYDDAQLILQNSVGKHVVIVGASFIGMEFAGTLIDKVSSVSVIDRAESPFFTSLGKDVGNATKLYLERLGVKFHLNQRVKEFVGEDNKLKCVILSDNTSITADLCVVAIGVVPDTDCFKHSGLQMTSHDYIIVDQEMRTNKKDVLAAGDCVACHLNDATGSNHEDGTIVQHWQWSQQQGRIAALSIMDRGVKMHSVPFYWTIIGGQNIRIAGEVIGHESVFVHGNVEDADFVAFYIKNGQVTGVASCNRDPVASQMAEFLLSGKTLTLDELHRDPLQWTNFLKSSSCTYF